jgi:Ca-activated chloride channel homolog
MAPNAVQGAPYRVPPPVEKASSPLPLRRVPLRAILLAFAGFVTISSAAAFYVLKPPPPMAARSIGARLDLAAGDVTVTDGSKSEKALSATPLGAGAKVETAKGARALVRTGEGAAVFMREGTTLELAGGGVALHAGEIWLDAPRVDGDALECRVGASVVSASDSGLSIRREGDELTVYVARGLAILTSPGGRVEIGAGEQAKARADAKPEVSPVAFWNDWTGGMGDQRTSRFTGSGSGRLYGLDPMAEPGAPARKLGIAKQIVRAVVRDGVAETEVDQTFSNPGGAPIEGWYWFNVPETATVTGFALETEGQLVEGEVIEKREAAARYEAAVRQAYDPALLEWVDGRTYRARIYPIPASGSRRVVLRYVEMLPTVEGKTRYVYPLRSDDPVRYDEFALSVDVGGNGAKVSVATSLDARVEGNGKVSMRRSGYVPRADFQLEIEHQKKRPPVAAWRFQAGRDQADYVMLRYVPEKDFAKAPATSADVVLVVDTSAGGDETSRALRIAAAEAALRALSDADHFAVVALDVAPVVVYPKEGLSAATEGDITRALEALSDHAIGGATDLGAMFEPALERLHGKEQAAVVYVGDGAPTSGETASEALVERLRRSLTGSRARFFAMSTGAGAHHALLAQLARAGGGQFVRVDESGQTTGQALRLASAIKTTTITDLAIDLGAGLDQPLYSATGKLSRGEELVLLARTHHPLPDKIKVRGRLAGDPFEDEHKLSVDSQTVTASLVPRLWAAEYARRLLGSGADDEDNRGQILQLGVEYGLVTPFTSSLALESEAAYARQGIPRRHSPVRGVRLTAIEAPSDEERLLRGILPAAPPTMMGCSRQDALSESEESVMERSRGAEAPAAMAPPPMDPSPGMAGEPSGGDIMAAPAATATAAPSLPMPAQPSPEGNASGAEPPPENRARAAAPKPAQRPAVRGGTAAAADREDGKDGDPLAGAALAQKNKLRNAGAPNPAFVRTVSRTLSRCSDVASRPLGERMLLWQKRTKRAQGAYDLASVYDLAYGSCELPDWRDEAALLSIIQRQIDTEQAAEIVLAHFSTHPDAQRFLARNLLRRTVDVRIAAAVSRVLYGGIDWLKVDREIADTNDPERQIARLKAAMLAAPGDPQGDVRLVTLLAGAGKRQEAMAHGRRLRDRGFLTPTLAQQLGDVLAEAGETDEAARTYSEIVEFDGKSPLSRRVLGDIYLRQGWYPAAYRQYKTLTDLEPKNPLGWLRLANAAAGAGRVDEALRIDREVASGEGTPGPNDPRMFARLLSASRLARLLDKPNPAAGVTPEAVSRKLKELTLFSGPGTLALLVWEDLDAQLVLGAADERNESLLGEATDAGAVGLHAVLSATEAWGRTPHAVRYRSEILRRRVPFTLVTLAWDGRAFQVTLKEGEVPAGAKQATL